jgi:hypothetical protein
MTGLLYGWLTEMSLAAVLDAATDDTLLAIAVALPTAADLLRLALTCRAAAQRFYFTATSYGGGGSGSAVPSGTAAVAQQQAETWSIIEEAARQWIAACTDQERGWVPRRGRERWLGLIWEVESLRRGVVFGRSHEEITLSEGAAVATKGVGDYRTRAAASKAVMRAGHHYAQFTVVGGKMLFGVIRPGWDARLPSEPGSALGGVAKADPRLRGQQRAHRAVCPSAPHSAAAAVARGSEVEALGRGAAGQRQPQEGCR